MTVIYGYTSWTLEELRNEFNDIEEKIEKMKTSLKSHISYINGTDYEYMPSYFDIIKNIEENEHLLDYLDQLIEDKESSM